MRNIFEFQSLKSFSLIRILLVLTLFVFSLQNYSNLSNELVNALFFIILLALSLLYFPANNKINLWFVFFSITSVIVITYIPAAFKLCFLSVYIYLLNYFTKKYNQSNSELKSLFVSSFVLSIFYIFYENVPELWICIQKMSHCFSSFNNYFFGNFNGNLGASYSGILTLFVFIIYFIIVFINSDNRKYILFVILLISLIFAFILYLLIKIYIVSHIISIKPEVFYTVFHFEFTILFFIPSTLVLINKFQQKANKEDEIFIKFKYQNIFAIISVVISMFFLTFNYTPQGNKSTIYLYQKGNLNWDLPTYDKFGALNGGMFGLLPEFLKNMKYFVIEDSTINQSYLQKSKVLVLINLNAKFSKKEKQLIWNFVKNGGSLLVLGDHTGAEVIRKPYNDLLKPFNIEFNFDCGIPFVDHWDRGIEYRPHYITQRLNNNSESNIGIGATLNINNRSNPIIIGKYGFSDKGNSKNNNNGFLGDMLYSTNENAGDLVLVAEQFYGNGKVLVFGDTSPFQNSEIIQGYEFLIDVFDYLSSPNYTIRYALLFSVIFLILSLYLAFYKYHFNYTLLLILIVCGNLVIVINTYINKPRHNLSSNAKIAYIDKSHLERFNLDQWNQNGLGGTGFCFIRNGYLPLQLNRFNEEQIIQSKVLFIVSPAKPFSKKEIVFVDNYMKQGGYVILSCGWDESNSVKTLLKKFNLSVLNLPLGKLESNQNSAMLSLPNAWSVYSNDNQYEILSKSSGYPVAVFKKIGIGGIFLIGDSKFFLNNNIEDLYTYNINNILFFKKVLQIPDK